MEQIMTQIMDYVKPELLVVAVVLYFIGMWIKNTECIADKLIPVILGCLGVIICAIWVFASSKCNTPQEIAMATFTAITQGVLMAGLSTYVNQVIKQLNKEE